jgi:hypothetical protein
VRRLLKRWRWILGGLVALLVAAVVTGWLLFQHIPAWYRPVQIPPDEAHIQSIRNDLVRTSDTLAAALKEPRGPFKFRLAQDQVNAWLSAREVIDPKTREWLPPTLSEPMVVFEPGGVRVGATYTEGNLRAVVSAKLLLTADGDGVRAKLEDVAGGSLALPAGIVRNGLKAFDRRVSPKLTEIGVTARDRRLRLRDLADGVVLPSTGKWPGSGQRFRVLGLDFEHGVVTVTMERLPYQPERRSYQDTFR